MAQDRITLRSPAATPRRPSAAAAIQRSPETASPPPGQALQQRLGNQGTQALLARMSAVGQPALAATQLTPPLTPQQPPALTAAAAPKSVVSREKEAAVASLSNVSTPGGTLSPKPSGPATAAATPATRSAKTPTGGPGAKEGTAKTVSRAPKAPAGRAAAKAGDGGESLKIDTNSSEGLLQSLRHVPASRLGESVQKAGAALPQVQSKEKAELQASYPVIERPTGLPRRDAKPKADAISLLAPVPLEAEQPGAREGQPPDEHVPEPVGPVPGSEVSTYVEEPAAEEEGSWWDRLVNQLKSFFSSLPTTDSGVATSAGERPHVDITGEADPNQNVKNQQAATARVTDAQAHADAATTANFGENDIYPTVPGGKMRPHNKPGPLPVARLASVPPVDKLPPDVVGAFNQKAAPWLDGKVGEQVDHYHEEQENYRQKSEETREEGRRQIAEATENARTDQQGFRDKARSEVTAEREAWRTENQLILKDYTDASETKRKETEEKIQTKVKDSEKQADEEMTKAETKAADEKRKAEEKAAEEKRKEESKPRSWWDEVKGAISSVFNAIKKAVTAIFDGLRWVVKQIIRGVKALVRGIIELARMAIVGLIKAFGVVLKGLVSIALVAFPKTAAKARAAIDSAVNTSVDAVNSAAEWLKSKTDAILDWVGNVLDKALGFLQTVITIGLEVMRLIATGQFAELWQKLKNLANSAWDGFGLVEGYVWEELIGFDISKPLGPQLTGAAGEEGGSTSETSQADEPRVAAPENVDLFLQETIRADQFDVQPVTELEVEDELLAQLSVSGGQLLLSEPVKDPERGLEAAKADLLAHLPQEPVPAGPQPVEEAGAMGDPKMQAIIQQAIAAKTRGERISIIKDLMFETIKSAAKKYWEEKVKPNLYWIIPAVLLGLAAFIAAEVLTGGAITAAIPVIIEIIGAAFIAQAIAKIAEGMGIWLEKAWAGDVAGAAKGFGKGFAGALIEILTALLMEVGGAALRATLKGIGKILKLAMRGAKALGTLLVRGGKGLVKGVLYLGKLAVKAAKITGSMMARGAKFLLEKGKLLFQGLQRTFAKGIKSVGELWARLKQWFSKFTGFSARIEGEYLVIYADFNPRRVIARILLRYRRLAKSTQKEVKAIAGVDRRLIHKAGGVFERLTTRATRAKEVVDSVVGKLASRKQGIFGRPDNISVNAAGLIDEVKEVKFMGRDLLEELGKLADENAPRFVANGLGEGRYIQLAKHVNTIEAIRAEASLIEGTVVKGVAKNVRYVVVLPKFTAQADKSAVAVAVAKMKRAWKSVLGIDVEVIEGSYTTKEIIDLTKALSKKR